ncbi:glycosyltransferase family, partial [Trichomonas vaginalis G3]|uniref:glycosyltransferase family n=1 Tax=Trichomonas vaginalis (strain ATCC PRA-98 / G3) TaxID=412133 RepID=UPI0021E53E34
MLCFAISVNFSEFFNVIGIITILHPVQKFQIKEEFTISKEIKAFECKNIAEMKELNFISPYADNKLVMLIGKGRIYDVLFCFSAAAREFTTYYHFQHVLVTSQGIFTDDSFLIFPWAKKTYSKSRITNSHREIDHLILGSIHFGPWGHFISDSPMAGLLYLPKDIVKKSKLAIMGNQGYVRRNLDELGFQDVPLHHLSWSFELVHNLYVLSPQDRPNGQVHFNCELRDHIFKLYNLSDIIPNYGVITNRPYGRARHVTNIQELIVVVKNHFMNIRWEFHDDSQLGSIKSCVQVLAGAKYFITPPGSSGFKAMMMKEKTGIYFIGSNFEDWANIGFCQSLGIWAVYNKNMNLGHIGSPAAIDIESNFKYIKLLIETVDKQKWPSYANDIPDSEFMIDLSVIKKILEIDNRVSILHNCNVTEFYEKVKSDPSHNKFCGDNIYYSEL